MIKNRNVAFIKAVNYSLVSDWVEEAEEQEEGSSAESRARPVTFVRGY